MKKNTPWPLPAIIITAFLLLLSIASLLYLGIDRQKADYVADIFQDGILIKSIPLNHVPQTETFTITGENGCSNTIEVRKGSIAIISADCPDKLCVHQGFISDSRLPITCLPNRLVIQLRPAGELGQNTSTPDIITY